MEVVLENEILLHLVTLLVVVTPLMVAGHHYKKYSFLQGFFSFLTVPMIFKGLCELVLFIFKDNLELGELILQTYYPLEFEYNLYYKILSLTNVEWLYKTNWIYMPAIVLFIFTYGYSITFRRKRKKRARSEE